MRLIDADILKESMSKRVAEKRDLNASFYEVINEQPTVDAVPTEFHDKCQQIEIQKRLKLEEELNDVVDRKLFNKVCEQFALSDPQWICDEMSDHDDEWEVCEENCEYSMCQPQCIERYARLLLKMDEVTDETI